MKGGRGRWLLLPALFLGTVGLLLVVFRGDGERRAVLVSATVALAVQSVALAAARFAPPGRQFMVWTAGAALRLVSLILYALLVVKQFGFPPVAALISLASLLFITTVSESLLLTS